MLPINSYYTDAAYSNLLFVHYHHTLILTKDFSTFYWTFLSGDESDAHIIVIINDQALLVLPSPRQKSGRKGLGLETKYLALLYAKEVGERRITVADPEGFLWFPWNPSFQIQLHYSQLLWPTQSAHAVSCIYTQQYTMSSNECYVLFGKRYHKSHWVKWLKGRGRNSWIGRDRGPARLHREVDTPVAISARVSSLCID